MSSTRISVLRASISDAILSHTLAASSGNASEYVSTNAFPEADNVQNNVYRTDFMAMRLIKARGKTFRMGSTSKPSNSEAPHNVTFSEPDFYMAVYPLTIGQTLNIGFWFDGDSYGIRDIRLDNCGWDYTLYQHHRIVDGVNSNYVALIVND